LAFNNLKEYSYFANSPNLTVLILSNNKITKIAKEVIKLQKLKTLDVENNDLSELPSELGFINSLVRLQV
jgi:Leucine-rich repeat (LRR) protein